MSERPLTQAEIDAFLETATPAEIEALYRLSGTIDDLKERDPLALYEPNEIQNLFHRSITPIKFLFGANGSGKTYAVCKEVVCHALEFDPSGTTPDRYYGKHPLHKDEPKIVWFCSVNIQKAKGMYDQTLSRMFPKGAVRRYDNYNNRCHLMNGNAIQLMSYEQDVRMWQSEAVDAVCLDEQPRLGQFKEAITRVFRKSGFVFCAMTPLYSNSPWTFREIIQKADKRADIDYWVMDLDHNIHLSEEQRERQKLAFADDPEKEARLHGRHTFMMGAIHPEFDDDVHIIRPFEIQQKHKDRYSFARVIDMHERAPNVCCWFMFRSSHDPVMLMIEDLRFPAGDVRGFAAEVERITERLNYGETSFTIIDTPDSNDTPGRVSLSLRTELAMAGIGGPKANRNHATGSQRFGEYLRYKRENGEPRFKIFNTCVSSINSIRYHVWDNYKNVSDESKELKEGWVHKDDHEVRNCHYMSILLPPLNLERVDAMAEEAPITYQHYHGLVPPRNRHA